MRLPIVQTVTDPSPADLVRLFHRTELHMTQHLGEQEQLDVGTAFTNPDLPAIAEANAMFDAALPPDVSPAEAVEQVAEHFAERRTRCARWVMNPSAAGERVEPLVEELLRQGHRQHIEQIMYLRHAAGPAMEQPADVKVIPARASYRHAREIAETSAAEYGQPQFVEAHMLHLDDPNWEGLVALHAGQAVATIGVLVVGEIGRIDEVYVVPQRRRQGLGRMMMSRAMEICARSLFRHVFIPVEPENHPAIALYEQLGFEPIGRIASLMPLVPA